MKTHETKENNEHAMKSYNPEHVLKMISNKTSEKRQDNQGKQKKRRKTKEATTTQTNKNAERSREKQRKTKSACINYPSDTPHHPRKEGPLTQRSERQEPERTGTC